ncbi:hypothetical protein CBM2589_B60041 [Cupriavidus taiwanensis]|uniref:Uncharacterized protein n=1 Tax=Cupriavidus taiwanensis TaxID=164546 RepID=A0A375BWJ3_9BURK|nr:hypothetical protein CBM2589_B60041 [Cupriavidus taiwanensis]
MPVRPDKNGVEQQKLGGAPHRIAMMRRRKP